MARDLQSVDTATVALVIRPESRAWILQGPISDGLVTSGRVVLVKGGDISAECTVLTMSVHYEDSRRASFLGERVVDRVVDLSFNALMTDQRSGRIIHTGSYAESTRDTIQVSAIPRVEESGVPVTKGDLPEEGFFTWMAEPLIMIGAVAVSVFLLFHVRS